MSQEPRFIVWRLATATVKDLRQLEQAVQTSVHVDAVISDAVITLNQGKEQRRGVEYRVSDYFARICALPGDKGETPSLRLFFHRQDNVNRHWKDVMAMILKQVQSTGLQASIVLDYRVDDEGSVAAAQVPEWFAHLGENSRRFWQLAASHLLKHPAFTFEDLAHVDGLSPASLRAGHRNSYRAIRAAQAADPLWSQWDHLGKRNNYTMDRVVRDVILSLAPRTTSNRRPRNVA